MDKTGPLEFGDFLAGTCSKMKLLGFPQALERLGETVGEELENKECFLFAFAISDFRECHSQYLTGSPRSGLSP